MYYLVILLDAYVDRPSSEDITDLSSSLLSFNSFSFIHGAE